MGVNKSRLARSDLDITIENPSEVNRRDREKGREIIRPSSWDDRFADKKAVSAGRKEVICDQRKKHGGETPNIILRKVARN